MAWNVRQFILDELKRQMPECQITTREDMIKAEIRAKGYRLMKRGFRNGQDQYWVMLGKPLNLDELEDFLNRTNQIADDLADMKEALETSFKLVDTSAFPVCIHSQTIPDLAVLAWSDATYLAPAKGP